MEEVTQNFEIHAIPSSFLELVGFRTRSHMVNGQSFWSAYVKSSIESNVFKIHSNPSSLLIWHTARKAIQKCHWRRHNDWLLRISHRYILCFSCFRRTVRTFFADLLSFTGYLLSGGSSLHEELNICEEK